MGSVQTFAKRQNLILHCRRSANMREAVHYIVFALRSMRKMYERMISEVERAKKP